MFRDLHRISNRRASVSGLVRRREFQHPARLEREDCTLVAWYRSIYAPRTGGAYDSHHGTAGIAGCTRRRRGVAARGGRAPFSPASREGLKWRRKPKHLTWKVGLSE